MESIGTYLKSIRETKNLSLEQVSEISKIKIETLRKIENDDFDGLGGYGYAKIMIVSYAREIEADEKKVLYLIKNSIKSEANFEKVLGQTRKHDKWLIPKNFFSIVILVIIVTILTCVVINFHKRGLLDFSLKKQLKKTEQQKPKPKKKVEAKKVEPPQIKKEGEDLNQHKEEEHAKPTINGKALRDTTDYVDNLLFEKKKSPFNVKD